MSHKKYNLGDSPAFKFNNELNNVIKNCRFCHSCDLEEYFIENYGLKVLCYRFVNNLWKIYNDFDKSENLNDKRCNDLIYWWYYNLNYTYNKLRTPEYDEIVNAFIAVWKNITQSQGNDPDKLCKNYFEKLLSIENYKTAKNVTDYCVNYEFIKEKLDEQGEKCTFYYHYLTDNSDKYKQTIKKCNGDKDNKYCVGINGCHTYDPNKLLDNEKCKLIEIEEAKRNQLEEEAANFIQCPFGNRCVEDDFFYKYITFSDYRFISLIVLSIWAIILSLFFLYKFSPFGSFLNNILNRKNIIRKNIRDEVFDELLESDSEDAPINFNNREYRITYNHE
ncbi:PIR Superfamily Protein [Plasmodium ovale wallikeri]|uniref:PIR Superfamily Protein n=1 Tax=Plasmodium ovale wallikeri TaxID=864142 RepID=A0A1A9ATD5_PLAOA|nr:PIR Superfamily Protein [Plasmodium ovale wallikeri]SBT59526.1 PIR Superfamily Protein [Plasmodium ovale wallikeri]